MGGRTRRCSLRMYAVTSPRKDALSVFSECGTIRRSTRKLSLIRSRRRCSVATWLDTRSFSLQPHDRPLSPARRRAHEGERQREGEREREREREGERGREELRSGSATAQMILTQRVAGRDKRGIVSYLSVICFETAECELELSTAPAPNPHQSSRRE